MNTLPTIHNPVAASLRQGRAAAQAVRESNPARDVSEPDQRRPNPPAKIDAAQREQLAARSAAQLHRQTGGGLRASRAVAAYADVALDDERRQLQSLLGLDTYA